MRTPGNKTLDGAAWGPFLESPGNLSGPLSGNFIGPDVAFLEAPVTFSVISGPGKIGDRYQTLARALHARSQEKENDFGLRVIHSISLPMEKHGYGCDRTVFVLFEGQYNTF